MIIEYIKQIVIKSFYKRNLTNVKLNYIVKPIETVGIIIDESYFLEKDKLIREVIGFGLKRENIKLLVFREEIKKGETFSYPTFTHSDIGWNGNFKSTEVNGFISIKFDLLISYYDYEKTILALITNNSKAQFKVGFSSVDKKLNHFTIGTQAENYEVFSNELFKYLKILHKI
jgi:hypothetical protein